MEAPIKSKSKYQWQGQPVKVEFGYCYVNENIEKPLYWYNYECSREMDKRALIGAVRITTEQGKFCLSNHFGIAVHKLINGGWPGYAHFSLDGETFEEWPDREKSMMEVRKFDLEGYEEHEAKRRTWQKKNYPEEFERSEALRRLIIKH